MFLKKSILMPILLVVVVAGLMLVAPTAKAVTPTPNPQQCQFVEGDVDQDGIADAVDPTPAGPDLNGNGTPDLIEPCMENPVLAQIETKEETCRPEDGDRDNDGLGDACDPAPDSSDADADGFPDSAEVLIGTDPLTAKSWPFDINGNGRADLADLLKFRSKLGKESLDAGFDRRFDLNVDGKVNGADLALFVGVMGKKFPARQATINPTVLSSQGYVASTAVYSKSCYSSYTGYVGPAKAYVLWVYATIYYANGRVTKYVNPPYYGANTILAGVQVSDLAANAYWYNSPYEVVARSSARFAYKLLGVTWWSVTRYAVASAGHSNGVTFCGKWSW